MARILPNLRLIRGVLDSMIYLVFFYFRGGLSSKCRVVGDLTCWESVIFSFCNSVSKCREATQCAGREITLNCSSPDWLIEVENELYGYNESRACDVSANTCTGVEFLDPPSIKHCNGKPSCSFNVPTDTYLSVCRENATSLKVIYQCVASKFLHTQKLKARAQV